MARASRAVADQHRTAIEAASARLFRQYGLHGVTVAQVMADAGLTHGGFYGHFSSKDDLA
ncbi:TetR family transcriptional regulator, partial [Cupriavidus sp. CER94]|uniref:TetR family transcriptional regulator n=1 Tax=Cupriavidus sp. CER94 TaxID=3377036 RepID=UPI003820B8D9